MENPDPRLLTENGSRKQELFLLFAAFLVPLFLLGILRSIAGFEGGEPGTDAFYHVKMGLLGPGVFCAEKFPLLASSLWTDVFADKELSYHFLLGGVTYLRKFITGSTEGPFTFQTVFFCALALGCFVKLLHSLKIPAPFIFLTSLLFPFCAASFTYRFLMLRPHVYSIALLLLFCAIAAEKGLSRRGRLAAGLLMGFLYSWSYSNSHFLLIPAFLYSFFAWRESREKKEFFFLLVTAVGLLLGGILHPQFPNTFHIWKVQGVDAMLGPLTGSGFASRLAPMEMQPGSLKWHLNNIPFYFLLYFILLMVCRLREKGKLDLAPAEKMIFSMGVIFSCGLFWALRSVEMAAPFMMAAFAILLKKVFLLSLPLPLLPFAGVPLKRYLVLLLAVLLFILHSSLFILGSAYRTKAPYTIAEFFRKNCSPNEVVCNMDWGDFPAMFFASGMEIRQLWGMDPVFSYAKDRKLARELERTIINSIYIPGMDRRLHELTGSKFAFLLSHRKTFIRHLKRQNWKVVFENEEGAVFALTPMQNLIYPEPDPGRDQKRK